MPGLQAVGGTVRGSFGRSAAEDASGISRPGRAGLSLDAYGSWDRLPMPSPATAVGTTEAHGFACQMFAAVLGVRVQGATSTALTPETMNVRPGKLPALHFSIAVIYLWRKTAAAATTLISVLAIPLLSQRKELTYVVWRTALIGTAFPLATNDPPTTMSLTTDCSSVTDSPLTTRIAAASPATLLCTSVVGLVAR